MTELKLLQTQVGVVVLSAGVGNDVVGWILLALCVALVNAGSGISALWVLLTCFGYVLVLTFAIRPVFVWVLKRSGSLQHGPTQTMVAMTILMMLASSFFTGIIGVHPIFGAFLVGLICPHDGGFAIKLTEKIEDLICAFFLPLYFALSGLSTNIGLLDSGITWAYVIGVIAVAFFGKVIGGTLAARFCGLIWRESFTIGALMSCKGLVELIVLVRTSKILNTQISPNNVEHWIPSQNSEPADFYYLRRHGFDYDICYHTVGIRSFSTMVPTKAWRMETGRD